MKIANLNQKILYFLFSLRKRASQSIYPCPSCGNKESELLDMKWFITSLRRCRRCLLQFRNPTFSQESSELFYNKYYSQGFTTELPRKAELRKYLNTGFRNTPKDFSTYIDILLAAGAVLGDRLLDFGCSWGYGSWQLKQKGFTVEGYEISKRMADFSTRKLGIITHTKLSNVIGSFDVVFTSHTLEHIPAVREVIDFSFRVLKPGGIFIAITPNGSKDFRAIEPKAWHQLWGLVHPIFLDNLYYSNVFSKEKYLLLSAPYLTKRIQAWRSGKESFTAQKLEGSELLLIMEKSESTNS